ncbi:hypothetical protein BH11MYX1_BH11MYX1_17590 [soil metagenome]
MAGPLDEHDTDPLADTAAHEGSTAGSKKKRAVHTGDVLGRYELAEDVGEGGLATVYRARDQELRREVAIKVLFPHLARRPEIVRRFHREARAAAGLEHANILRIYDVGGDVESDDPPFIVMELIRGSTLLGEIERRGPMFAEVVACVGALLAEALAAAHAAGIIHRDIKPANVLVAQDGRLLLADFGVARLETEDSLVTKTGALLGTPAYMSPEQATGDTATAKSDLYSLGATLYQLATGSLPYAGSPARVMAQIATGQRIAAVKKRAEVGPDLSGVIDRLMATEPEARPARAKEVAAELRALASAAGFGDPALELEAYLKEPAAFLAAKTPAVVAALVTAGKRAITDAKLPRALAIADRASALAPQDPSVIALVTAVTEGGRSSARRRVIGIGAIALACAAGATFGVIELRGGALEPVRDASAMVASASDAPVVTAPDAPIAVVLEVVHDAGGRRDASRVIATARDAGLVIDAPIVVEAVLPDAHVAEPVAAQRGMIRVNNDTWCDVTIDRISQGRADRPYPVEVGRHTVTCAQPGTHRTWTREVEIAANETATVTGTMLAAVAIHFEVAATWAGQPFAKGAATTAMPGQYKVRAGSAEKYVGVTGACTVRDQPELGCYP